MNQERFSGQVEPKPGDTFSISNFDPSLIPTVIKEFPYKILEIETDYQDTGDLSGPSYLRISGTTVWERIRNREIKNKCVVKWTNSDNESELEIQIWNLEGLLRGRKIYNYFVKLDEANKKLKKSQTNHALH